ncbi:MAG: 5-formyltetrahydrofolate cyclo-ligase [Halioglobus sp.]|nr:5-formyltetrahydrofolate cyclo-ligase [Halioglobus sp.]
MTDVQVRKARLRNDLRQCRNDLSAAQQTTAAQALILSIMTLPNWASAQRVALYLAADGEIGTGTLESAARSLNKALFLPVITDDRLCFAQWHKEVCLSSNRYNIPEPPKGALRCPASDLDIIFIPTVGWDERGGRIGMGGGFYDRTLSGIAGPLLVGLAHDNQQVDEIPLERWDIALDYVATDVDLYTCHQRQPHQ